MKLYHYFEKERGPFSNLSDLELEVAERVLLDMIYADSISFTYGDIFPVFGLNGNDSMRYRKNVYYLN